MADTAPRPLDWYPLSSDAFSVLDALCAWYRDHPEQGAVMPMPSFHRQLVLEYFCAKSVAERTEATLAALAQHVATTYQLSDAATEELRATVLTAAYARHLLRP